MNRNEVDSHVGNEITNSLTKTIQQIDTLIATSVQLEKTGTREDILLFAERTSEFTSSTLTSGTWYLLRYHNKPQYYGKNYSILPDEV